MKGLPMNPLIPTAAIQIRYESPVYEPYYDDDDNIIDEDCVEPGTDVWNEVIKAVHNDGIPRYYRLRYRGNAKDHKKRWNKCIYNVLTHEDYYCVKVSLIGRRVLFTYDPKLSMERDKLFKRQEFLAKKRKRIQEREARQQAEVPSSNTWENPNANGITGFVVDDEEPFASWLDFEAYYNDMEEQHVAQEEERWKRLTAEVQERRNDYEER